MVYFDTWLLVSRRKILLPFIACYNASSAHYTDLSLLTLQCSVNRTGVNAFNGMSSLKSCRVGAEVDI